MPKPCPSWLPYALAEVLLHEYRNKAWPIPQQAFDKLQASCHDLVGWGVDGKPGLAEYKGYANANDLWQKVCKKFFPNGAARRNFKKDVLQPYCLKEMIYLAAGEKLLEYQGRAYRRQRERPGSRGDFLQPDRIAPASEDLHRCVDLHKRLRDDQKFDGLTLTLMTDDQQFDREQAEQNERDEHVERNEQAKHKDYKIEFEPSQQAEHSDPNESNGHFYRTKEMGTFTEQNIEEPSRQEIEDAAIDQLLAISAVATENENSIPIALQPLRARQEIEARNLHRFRRQKSTLC